MSGAHNAQVRAWADSPVMLRVASASVEESAAWVDAEGGSDDLPTLARLAIGQAAGPDLLRADTERAAESVSHYLARMGGRATPYGLFAGTAPGRVAQDRRLVLGAEHRVRSRVDIAVLEQLVADAVARDDGWGVPLRANPTLRVVAPVEEGKAATVRFTRPGDASADVVEVRATGLVVRVLERLDRPGRSPSGRTVLDELTTALPQQAPELIAGALRRIIDSGLLQHDDGLIVPGREPIDVALELLEALGAPETEAVRRLRDDLSDTASVCPGLEQTWRTAWAAPALSRLDEVPGGRRLDHQLLLDLDDATVDATTVDALAATARRVQRLMGAGGPGLGEVDLTQFVTDFAARYEDAEVPLLEAVDPESGVLRCRRRQLSTLSGDAGVIAAPGDPSPVSVPEGVFDLYRRSCESPGAIDIDDLPQAEALTSRGLAGVLLDPDRSPFLAQLVGGMGRSPLALMGRFALGRSEVEQMFERCRAAEVRQRDAGEAYEEQPIRAELAYHPGGRIGNVLIRPRVHDDVVALGGAGGGTLALDRLLIRLVGGSVRLRDRVSGRPVLLELTTAHNVDFAGLDPVYALLGRLATAGGCGWGWGALERLPHLPRVVCGRILVAPEHWRLSAAAVDDVRSDPHPATRLRQLLRIDDDRRWVGTGAMDQVLPLDLTSDRSVRAGLARQRGTDVRLVELPSSEAPATRGPHGHHVTEVHIGVGPILRPAPADPAGRRLEIDHRPEQSGPWVYAQLFCGPASADQIATRTANLAERLRGAGLVDQWFFLRYALGGHHLRVRLRAAGADRRGRVLDALDREVEQWRRSQLVGRVVWDTYVPEVARYGGHSNLALAEQLFDVSSTQVAGFLATAPTEAQRLARAVADATVFARSAAPDSPQEQLVFLQRCGEGLAMRFSRRGNRQGKTYREHRAGLADAVGEAAEGSVLAEPVAALVKSVHATGCSEQLTSVVGSALHLHCNRIFGFDAVRMEYLSHEFAVRQLRERHARTAP